MSLVRSISRHAVFAALSVLSLAINFSANRANAAPERLDVNGNLGGSGITTAGSPYSWEAAGYSSAAAGTDPVPWVENNFLRLAAGTDAGTSVYTLNASANHTITGMFLQSGGGGSVTVNGPGVLSIAAGVQGFLVNSSTQALTINASLAGVGGVTNSLSGSLNLFGNNSYGGGTDFGSVAGMNFNNDNSFGTGPMTWKVATQVLANDTAVAPITLPNAMNTRAASTLIYVGPAVSPVTFTNAWTLAPGTSTVTVGNATHVSSQLSISGAIGGVGGNLVVNGTTGKLTVSGANTYNGTTTVGGTSKLVLGAAGTIASSSSLILNGGTVDPNGFTQTMATTTLGLLANSTIDFGAGTSEMDFANSSALSWTGTTLNLLNWNPSIHSLRIGTDATGLTAAQLAKIQFNGGSLGFAQIDSNGYIFLPEPASAVLLMIGGLSIGGIRRRKTAGVI